MRIGFPILALIIVVFASATPIAFVKAQGRNQTQSQEGLSEKSKKTLSRMGPEDILGLSGEDANKRGAATTSRQPRRGTPTPTPSAPSPRQSPASATAQPPATQPAGPAVQPSVAAPSPTIPAATLSAGDQQSPLSQGDSSDKIDSRWAAPALIIMALFVSLALIFTLTKLVEKIREGSSG
jgi:hypothetical protein